MGKVSDYVKKVLSRFGIFHYLCIAKNSKQSMKSLEKTLLMLLGLLMALTASAQIRGNNIVVNVQPDHQDWNYRVGEKARFTVSVLRSSTLLNNVEVSYEAGPEMYPETKKTTVLKDGTMTWTGTMKKPGFYRLKVTAKVGGREYSGACTAAFSPEKLQPTTVCPDDFDAFWQHAIEESRWTALEPTRQLLPDRCTKDVNVYQVSFQNVRWGSRTYGILCVPVKPGRYPALLRVPGAGVRPYQGDVYTASQGAITLEIGIHGIDVTQPQDIYDRLNNGALSGYWNFGLASRDDSYYKRVVLGCIRAIDYIEQFTDWNGRELGVTGSSQGGFLTYATAALDPRVTFAAAVHPALCDHTASLQGVACGWPHYFYWNKGKGMEREITTSRYYDGVNFARRIKCPTWVSFGYNDDVVPPTTAYATYNILTAPKTLSVYQQTAHFWYQEQWDEWQQWLLQQMNIDNAATRLADRLETLQKRGYMAGHQDDSFYGLDWEWEWGRSDIRDLVGDYPAVMGFDLGGIEVGDQKNLDSVPFLRIREQLVAHVERGGIVTVSWHPRNPLTGGTAWDVKTPGVVTSILPGGSQHQKFQLWMQRVGDFLASLKDASGQPVPVVFRPWHENNGSWFWWGQNNCTDREFRELWNMLQDYLRNDRQLHNLLWSYSPNLDGQWTLQRFLTRYPGNDRVTLIGEDAYQWGTEQDFLTAVSADLTFLSAFCRDNGKLLALTECGLKNMTDATWWTRVLKPVMDRFPISYFLLWRNYKKEFFGPSKTHPCGADYKRLYDAPNTLFLNDISRQ